MKLIIYMPALNEEGNIERVIANLPQNLAGVDEILTLVVDDGSTDNTAALVLAAGAHVISHGKNLGVVAAFHSAVNFALEACADILVGIDADEQFDLSYAKFISASLALFVCFVSVNGWIGIFTLLYWMVLKTVAISIYLWLGFITIASSVLLFWLPLNHMKIPARLRFWASQAVDGWMYFIKNPVI